MESCSPLLSTTCKVYLEEDTITCTISRPSLVSSVHLFTGEVFKTKHILSLAQKLKMSSIVRMRIPSLSINEKSLNINISKF